MIAYSAVAPSLQNLSSPIPVTSSPSRTSSSGFHSSSTTASPSQSLFNSQRPTTPELMKEFTNITELSEDDGPTTSSTLAWNHRSKSTSPLASSSYASATVHASAQTNPSLMGHTNLPWPFESEDLVKSECTQLDFVDGDIAPQYPRSPYHSNSLQLDSFSSYQPKVFQQGSDYHGGSQADTSSLLNPYSPQARSSPSSRREYLIPNLPNNDSTNRLFGIPSKLLFAQPSTARPDTPRQYSNYLNTHILNSGNSPVSKILSSPYAYQLVQPMSSSVTSSPDGSPIADSKPGLGVDNHSETSPGDENKKRKRVSQKEDAKEKTVKGQAKDHTKDKDSAPTKSPLHPPKPAPSSWQIFFTDYLRKFKDTHPDEKLNVAHVAKEAGTLYQNMSSEEKEVYKKRARKEKEIYDKTYAAWQKTLTPDDIRNENAFRTAQRRAGKSKKMNIKDPNAPKKPLSPYFMYLAAIRADRALSEEVFGTETETTKQSQLAAAKWNTLEEEEKRPFLERAEQEKLVYNTKYREYEDKYMALINNARLVLAKTGSTSGDGSNEMVTETGPNVGL